MCPCNVSNNRISRIYIILVLRCMSNMPLKRLQDRAQCFDMRLKRGDLVDAQYNQDLHIMYMRSLLFSKLR